MTDRQLIIEFLVKDKEIILDLVKDITLRKYELLKQYPVFKEEILKEYSDLVKNYIMIDLGMCLGVSSLEIIDVIEDLDVEEYFGNLN